MSFLSGLDKGLHRAFDGTNLAMTQAILAGDYQAAAAIRARQSELERQLQQEGDEKGFDPGDAQVIGAKNPDFTKGEIGAMLGQPMAWEARRRAAGRIDGPEAGGAGEGEAGYDALPRAPNDSAPLHAPPPGKPGVDRSFLLASDRYGGPPAFGGGMPGGQPGVGQFPGGFPNQAMSFGYPRPPLASNQDSLPVDRKAAVQQAAAAIRGGADPKAVRARLNELGMDNPDFGASDHFFDLMPGGRQGRGARNPSEVAQEGVIPADQPLFARDSVSGRYDLNRLAGGAVTQKPTSLGAGNSQLPQGFVGPDGASPAQTGTFIGGQSGPDATFHPAAYAQDHLDTLQDRAVAYDLARQRGGDPEDWFQMLRGRPPRAGRDSLPQGPAVHAAPLPNDHPLPNPSHMEGDDIVVTGPRLASREVARHSSELQEVGRLIGTGEGNYESYNSGTLHNVVLHHSLNSPPSTVTGRTINEILSTDSLPPTDPRRMHVVGRYEISHDNLARAVSEMRLTGNEHLTPELQDRIFAEYLVPHTPALADFIFRGRGTVDDAQYAASRVWASIAVPQGRRTKQGRMSNGGMTFFDNTGRANRANRSATNALRTYLMNLHR